MFLTSTYDSYQAPKANIQHYIIREVPLEVLQGLHYHNMCCFTGTTRKEVQVVHRRSPPPHHNHLDLVSLLDLSIPWEEAACYSGSTWVIPVSDTILE